ncbi:hypothetical protein GY45DRAFT_1257848 [Cubamyces sp. BRFM 1775]|nr:hypothetical protein GY45DRAFT_1257848 [Cubamyces sp. BRFM 1775]
MFYRCVAPGCLFLRYGQPQSSRVLQHAIQCRKLSPALRQRALEWAASRSLSAELAEPSTSTAAGAAATPPSPLSTLTSTTSTGMQTTTIQPMHMTTAAREATTSTQDPKVKKGGLGEVVVAAGRAELRTKLYFRIMKLICVRGLVPTILDTDEWKEFLQDANPRYQPTSTTTFVDKHIPSEAAQVRLLQIEVLKQLDNLTLTYDGGSTRKPQSMYTVHITTPDRRVFFIEGDEASRERHTAEHIKKLILEVMQRVGVDNFSAICSDNTGNTRKARDLLVRELPAILNLLDCCHHLHNTSKDITRLSDFNEVISNLRKIIKYFKKSNISATELALGRAEEGGIRGLQSIGKTRFATVYWSAESLRVCLPVLRRLVKTNRLILKDVGFDKGLLEEGNMASMTFEIQLRRYVSIIEPIARAIKSLEATDATAANVFVFWHSIAAELRNLLARPESETSIPRSLAEKIIGIINRRFKEVIDQALSDVYFTTFFLHPLYAQADILAKPTTISNAIFVPPLARGTDKSEDDSHAAPIPRAYYRAKEFLKGQLRTELQRNVNHVVRELAPKRLISDFRHQLMAYAKGEWPFNQPLDETKGNGRPVLQWWLDLGSHPHAQVLAMLAIKLYSIAVNSMADERTASNFTWFNSALRNRQEVRTLVNMIQVRQWYLQTVGTIHPHSGDKNAGLHCI